MPEFETIEDRHVAGPLWLLPLTLTLVLGFLGYQQWLATQPRPPIPAPSPMRAIQHDSPVNAAASNNPDSAFTYYLVSSGEQAVLVEPLLLQLDVVSDPSSDKPLRHVFKIVNRSDEEQQTRAIIDDANKQ